MIKVYVTRLISSLQCPKAHHCRFARGGKCHFIRPVIILRKPVNGGYNVAVAVEMSIAKVLAASVSNDPL